MDKDYLLETSELFCTDEKAAEEKFQAKMEQLSDAAICNSFLSSAALLEELRKNRAFIEKKDLLKGYSMMFDFLTREMDKRMSNQPFPTT